MRLLIMNKYGTAAIKETSILPRIRDKVDLFYKPLPEVVEVCLFPSKETLKECGIDEFIDAVITVE